MIVMADGPALNDRVRPAANAAREGYMPFLNREIKFGIVFALLIVALHMGGPIMAAEPEYSKIIQAIAQDILGLRAEFPQLKRFSPDECVHLENLSITYAYHTHQPRRRAGWAGGVPNPDEDGVWFYIDIHDRDSQAQIHTQPVTFPIFCIGEKRISHLMLEGKKTKSLEGRINAILEKHGAKPCSSL